MFFFLRLLLILTNRMDHIRVKISCDHRQKTKKIYIDTFKDKLAHQTRARERERKKRAT